MPRHLEGEEGFPSMPDNSNNSKSISNWNKRLVEVKMKKIALLLPLLSLTACLFGSSKMIQPDARVASVDGRLITFGNLDSLVISMDTKIDKEETRENLKEDALDSLIIEKLTEIRIDSIMAELDHDWEFVQKRKASVGEAANKILFDEKIKANISVDSASVTEYYENNKSNFVEREQVKARHILIRRPAPDTADVKTEKQKKKKIKEADDFARKRADAVLNKALAGSDWDSLVTAYSEDKTNSSKGGDLGYFLRGRMVPEFDSVAFSTPPGKIVGPVSTTFGYHIIRVDDYKPQHQKPLDDDIRTQIDDILRREQEKTTATAFLDSLKANGVYQFNEEVLASDDSLQSPDTWVMSVNSSDTLFYKNYADALPRYKKWKQLETLTVDDKKEMLTYLQTNLLLYSATKTLGYIDRQEIKDSSYDFTRREAGVIMENYLRDMDYNPSDEEIETYYNEHLSDYTVERKLNVYHIIFQDEKQAEAIRDSILAGADFVEMAKRYYPGEPEIREVAYNLDYIGPRDMGDVFYAAANKLKPGEISNPVKTDWGYHIIKLVNRKEDKTLSQVRPGIKSALKNNRNSIKKAGIVDQWMKNAKIDINHKLVNKYRPAAQG